MVLNYVTVMNIYHMFWVALRSGDAILIEWVYREVLPLFNITGKKHYFEIYRLHMFCTKILGYFGLMKSLKNTICKTLFFLATKRTEPITSFFQRQSVLSHVQYICTLSFSHCNHSYQGLTKYKFVKG